VWDHADMMHNIINSLRGEAVPEQGAMHGSAIQVSRQITSPRLCPTTCVRFNDSCFANIGQKPSGRRYRLGRWKDLPAPSISDYRHGTASHQKCFRIPLLQRVEGLEFLTFSASHLFLCPVKADNFSGATEAGLMK
jgi:hypothetical protein